MQHSYPPHLSEPIRWEIAKAYLKQEFRKYFPQMRGKEVWGQIDKSIEDKPYPDPLLKGEGKIIALRDFWNSVWGVAMGFKLKIGFIQILTAENISWEFAANLPLDNKLAGGGDLKYIHPDLAEKRPRAQRLREFFQENQTVADDWRKKFRDHGLETEPRDDFPIIVMEETDNNEPIYSVYDGNRRMILSVLENKQTIPAYVGRYVDFKETSDKRHKFRSQDSGLRPASSSLNLRVHPSESIDMAGLARMTITNFWLPTPFLMELVKETELTNTEKSYEETLALLKDLVKLSESGKYELLNRVLVGNNKFRVKLKKDLESIL